jgi:hypothetical protein
MQENQPDVATHTLIGKIYLEKCKKVVFIEKKSGVGVCVAVPWHSEQYVFPEASTLGVIFFHRFMCLLSTYLRW